MIEKIKTIYYCEHCGKYRFRKHSMKAHEDKCTANPNRSCVMCAYVGSGGTVALLMKIPPVILSVSESTDAWTSRLRESFEKVKKESDCPACMLSWLRQSGASSYDVDWDYFKACAEFWENENREFRDAVGGNYGI